HIQAARLDAGQVEKHDEPIAVSVRVHRHDRRPSQRLLPQLLGEAVEVTERIEPQKHQYHLLQVDYPRRYKRCIETPLLFPEKRERSAYTSRRRRTRTAQPQWGARPVETRQAPS